MNLPNRLTVLRLVLTVVFLAVLLLRIPFAGTGALVLFVAASLTDYYDGKIARASQQITNFGVLMDPLADKILICSAFIAFVGRGIASWMVIAIVARELAITGLRLLAASKQVVLAAEGYGKHKTVSQMVAIISVLVLAGSREWGELGRRLFSPWISEFTVAAEWAAVLLTLFSGWFYLWRNRQIYMEDL